MKYTSIKKISDSNGSQDQGLVGSIGTSIGIVAGSLISKPAPQLWAHHHDIAQSIKKLRLLISQRGSLRITPTQIGRAEKMASECERIMKLVTKLLITHRGCRCGSQK